MDKIEGLRSVMDGMGFAPDRIDAAITVLGDEHKPAERNEGLLCQKEVCAELKISHTTLWRIAPPSYKVGGRKRYKLSEVIAHMQGEAAA